MLNFPKNKHFLSPDTRGKKCLFFRRFGVLCFLETPVLGFALLSNYRRNYDNLGGHDTDKKGLSLYNLVLNIMALDGHINSFFPLNLNFKKKIPGDRNHIE